MEELFERAEKEGLWFHTSYQEIWLSPRELREQQAQGRFQWGAINWQLRNPFKRLAQLEEKIKEAHREHAAFLKRIQNEQARSFQK